MNRAADQISGGSTLPVWRQDEYLRDLHARLEAQADQLRVVSFDFFDTLVWRLCAEPSDLFIEVGRRLAEAGLFRAPMSPEEFHAVRTAADDAARRLAMGRGQSSEITLAIVYQELGAVLTDPAAGCQIEFETERHFCFVNPSMAGFVQHVRSLGLKAAVISDTYFTRNQLCQLLVDNGLDPSIFDHIFVSSEAGCAKWDGRLFLKACAHFEIHPNELLHLGDNERADVQMARQAGAEAVHYRKATRREAETFERERALATSKRRPAASVNALRALSARLARDGDDAFRDGAFVFGPVLSLYADWCVRRFQAAGARTVLALMREGDLLGELVANAARAAAVDLRIVPCFVSRLSTARASISEVTPSAVAGLLDGSPAMTLRNILEILGILDDARDLIPREILGKPIAAGAAGGVLSRLMAKPTVRELVTQRCRESAALAFEYLDGLTGGDARVGFVDLGWSGSIQRNILRILRNGGRQLRGIGCYLATTSRAGRLALDGDQAHGFMDSDWTRNTILPEIATTACIGSTNGYARGTDGTVVPVFGDYSAPSADRRTKARLREGVLTFQTSWLALRTTKGELAMTPAMRADVDDQAGAMLTRLIEYPGTAEAERLGSLTHDENYWDRHYTRALCEEDAGQRLVARGAADVFATLRCYWPQGVVARRHPRLIAALSRQWADPLALGRAGATRDAGDRSTHLTDDERASLVVLLRQFAPRQVLLASRAAVALEADIATLAATPALVSFSQTPTGVTWHRRVEGDPVAPATLRAVRASLAGDDRHALVLTGEFDAATVTALLNGLAPFLGAGGVILARCGDSDLVDSAAEHPLTRTLAMWLSKSGLDLGYGAWQAAAGFAVERRNWIVLVRGQAVRESNHHWHVTLADLPIGARFAGEPVPVPLVGRDAPHAARVS